MNAFADATDDDAAPYASAATFFAPASFICFAVVS